MAYVVAMLVINEVILFFLSKHGSRDTTETYPAETYLSALLADNM
jgi:hypothetical protein